MKIKMIVVILLLIGGFSRLSAYKSIFGNDTTRWHIYEFKADAGGTIDFFSYSDTLILDPMAKQYLPCHQLYWDYVDYDGNHKNNFPNFGGLIYEDTINGIWRLLHSGYKKISYNLPIMDMNLVKGDSFRIERYPPSYLFEWVFVDTVYFIDGRKIIEFDWEHLSWKNGEVHSQKLQFIEGIGPSYGFYLGIDEAYPEIFSLLCKFDNSELIYSSIIDDDCWKPQGASVNDKISDKQIVIYPNPVNEELTIRTNIGFENESLIEIFDLLGRRMHSENDLFRIGIDKKINIKNLSRGVHFIRISTGTEIFVGKFYVIR